MSVGSSIDAVLDRAQKAGPYAVSIALAGIGLAIYHAGVHDPIEEMGFVMRLTGSRDVFALPDHLHWLAFLPVAAMVWSDRVG